MLNPGDRDERRKLLKLLDRLDTVDRARAPRCMPDVIADQWLHGDTDARQKIEEAIDHLPKRKRSN